MITYKAASKEITENLIKHLGIQHPPITNLPNCELGFLESMGPILRPLLIESLDMDLIMARILLVINDSIGLSSSSSSSS